MSIKSFKIDIIYIYIIFLILLYFIYGLTLSEIIDYIFPMHDATLPNYRIALEIIGEIGIAFIIYYSLKRYSEQFVNILFSRIKHTPPTHIYQILLIAFSIGIFKHLQKSTDKINHFKKKISTFINSKEEFKLF